jgi:hypothetical protein
VDGRIIVDPHLGRVVAEYTTVHVTVERDLRVTESHEAPLLLAPTVGGQAFGEFAVDFISQLGEDAQDEESRRVFAEARLLVWLHAAVPSPDPRRSRALDPRSFERSESLAELTRVTNTQARPIHGRYCQAGSPGEKKLEPAVDVYAVHRGIHGNKPCICNRSGCGGLTPFVDLTSVAFLWLRDIAIASIRNAFLLLRGGPLVVHLLYLAVRLVVLQLWVEQGVLLPLGSDRLGRPFFHNP